MKKLFYFLFKKSCTECGEVLVLAWRGQCSFCDKGEGAINEN
jgi:hypothetical protein